MDGGAMKVLALLVGMQKLYKYAIISRQRVVLTI